VDLRALNDGIHNSQSMVCRPRALTEIKFGFVQWLALFAAFASLFALFEASLFRLHAFDTFCVWDNEANTRKSF
jgi:hypothetical protein